MSPIVPDLSDKQLQAIELMMSHQNFSDIAKILDIDRRTLWRWRKLPGFAQVIAERQATLHEEIQGRMGEIMRLSMVAIERELKKAEDPFYSNPLATALCVLKLAQPQRLLQPTSTKAKN